jgi:hypothetical protein
MDMGYSTGEYRVTVKGADIPQGKRDGVWEFYITAEDQAGNQSQSTLDRSVELLLCVSGIFLISSYMKNVEFHADNIYSKIGVRTRLMAGMWHCSKEFWQKLGKFLARLSW